MSDLVICRLSDASASVAGGKEVILLCEKVTKGKVDIKFYLIFNIYLCILMGYLDDIQVRFFEEKDGKCIWESYADFQPQDVHKQVAIYFRTPKYRTSDVNLIILITYLKFQNVYIYILNLFLKNILKTISKKIYIYLVFHEDILITISS